VNQVMGVYAIINEINGNRYIGSSCDIGRRWAEHATALEHGYHHNKYLQRAYKKYGKNAFKFVLIETAGSVEQLQNAEDWFLKTLKPEYNMTLGVVGTFGYHHTEESKAKMSVAKQGVNHPYFGKKRPAIVCQRISDGQRGKKLTPEQCKAISERNKGKRQFEHMKPIYQFDLQGNLIGLYVGLGAAAIATGLDKRNISKAANNPGLRCGNFMWGHTIDAINKPYVEKSAPKPVEQYTKDELLIAKFASTSEASRITGVHYDQISGCARKIKHYHTAGGFIWRYADEAVA